MKIALVLSKSDWVRASLLVAAYFVTAQIGLSLSLVGHSVTVFWPPSGIALAILLLYGYRLWPGVLLGSFCANYVSGLPLLAVLGMSTGSTLEALLGAYLLNQHARFTVTLPQARDIFRLTWRGGILSTLVSALIGPFCLVMAGAISWEAYRPAMLFWWMGDALGVVLFTPMVIALLRHRPLAWTPLLRQQAALFLFVLLVSCVLVFTDLSRQLFGHQLRAFVLVAMVVWAALSFNLRFVSLVLLLISLGAVFSGASGQGYFNENSLANVFDLWAFIVVLSMVGVTLTAVNYQRNRARLRLEHSEHNLNRAQSIGHIGSWYLDVRQNVLTWSDETCRIFEISPGQALSYDRFMEYVHLDDRQAVDQAWQAALRGEQYDVLHRIVVNGRIKWVRERADLDVAADGTLLGGIGTVQDITQHKLAEDALLESQSSQQAIIDSALDAVIQMDMQGRIVGWNRQAALTFGWSREEVLGGLLHEFIIPPQHREAHLKGLQRLLAGGAPHVLGSRIEVEGLHRDGHILAIELSITQIQVNEITQFSAFIRDITRRKQKDSEIRMAAKFFDSTNEAILITDADKKIVTANEAFLKMTCYSMDDIKGRDPAMFASGEHDADFYEAMWHSIDETGGWKGEVIDKNRHGQRIYKQMNINAVRNEKGELTHYISIASDISERKEYVKNVHFLAYYDVLTGLPNRTLLRDRIGQMIAAAHRDQHRFALLFLDLDRFKYINDSMGHSVGDRLLQSVAQRLQECVREGDTVSRIGGDEFIVLLREIDESSVELVAQKILTKLAVPYDLSGQVISTYGSIGIALYPDHATDIDVLMKNADAAMYRAKESGRNNFKFFTQDMHFRANQLFLMEKDLRIALEQDQFTLVYQPQVDLASGRICGAEALLRWKHPEKGYVSPAEFIPIAEETGQIVVIGEWVLRTACWRMATWQKQGMAEFPVAVNLSIRQLQQPGLGDAVVSALKESGLKPELLELEITEGIMMGDTKHALSFLARMHALGVQMSIDDFGTGFSSLNYLKNLPVHKLKIDQSFVRDIETDKSDAAIVRSIVSLGHRLDLRVIAEGVETVEQLDFLRIRGCDEIQGYLYSRPLSAVDFAKFAENPPPLPSQWALEGYSADSPATPVSPGAAV